MLHSNSASDRLSMKHIKNSNDWGDQGGNSRYDSNATEKNDRVNRKRNAEARRRIENIREDLQLKALIDGDRWF